jgi:hypothetical protein
VIAWIFSHEKHDNLLIINCWMSAENSQMLSTGSATSLWFWHIGKMILTGPSSKLSGIKLKIFLFPFCWLYEIGSINKGEYITCRHLHFFFMLQQAVHGLWYGLWTSAGLVRILLIFGRQLAVFKHILGLGHHVYNAS